MYEVDTILSVKDLSVKFKNVTVLNNINLNFSKNKITTIVGPSGSGKSTLLRSLNRINDDVEGFNIKGCICIDHQDIYSRSMKAEQLRSRIGMVFQKPCVFPGTIKENVLFGIRFKQKMSENEKKALIKDTLIDVCLWDQVSSRLDSKANQLSVGQQQKLCMARTLAMCPDIVLLDEPTSSLDPLSAQSIEDLMIELKKKYTIICVTHNLDQAKKISDNIVFMNNGQVIESGCKSDILSNPSDDTTKEYFKDYYCISD